MFQTLLAMLATLAASPAKGHAKLQLVAPSSALPAGSSAILGLKFAMEPEWHVYWKNPGDAGFSLSVAWDTLVGAKPDSLQWPVPDTIAVFPLMTYGYRDSVLLPLPVSIDPAAKRVRMHGKAKWLECKDVCVPGKAEISIDLPVGKAVPDPVRSAEFDAATRNLPRNEPDRAVRVSISDSFVVIEGTGKGGVPGPLRFLPLDQGVVDNAAAQRFEAKGDGFRLTVRRDAFVRLVPDTLRGVLKGAAPWPSGNPGWRIAAAPAPLRVSDTASLSPAVPAKSSGLGILGALGLAFAGGLVLNLMPCVLPILSLKALDLLKMRSNRPLRHGLAYTAGVLISFVGLALVLVLLRRGGAALGWGFQLQSPATVAVLSLAMVLVALSLWGVFEPGASLMGVFGTGGGSTGLAGAFLTGVLATVVASPCTGPFMGTAIGWALVLPDSRVFLVFAAMGAGLAFPFLVLSANPRWTNRLPKPGVWMEVLKQSFGFAMAGAAAWLAWILGRLGGADQVALLCALWLVVGLAAWILGRGALPHHPRWGRVSARAAFFALVGTAVVCASGFKPREVGPVAGDRFGPGTLAELRASGKPWMLDFTAAWCLTCLANERIALSTGPVRSALREKGVRLVKADWTSRDTAISLALESFGRQGVPYYVLSDGRTERPLPELLTESVVLAALDSLRP